jgi:hypothetical protein
MCNKIINQQYNIDLPDDEPFYFNIKEDSEGNVLIQNGSELKHAHIMLTSKKLMANCERQGMIHIDGTYKLVKNHFPVVVIGITDIAGQFHPIAFCITSSEDTHSFTEFYRGLLELAEKMGIEFYPDFIMQDSWDASLTGASKAGIKAVILMCYFHVIYNIKKLYKHKLTKAEWHELRGYMYDIHLARSELERDERWAKFKGRYKPKKGLLYSFNSQYLFTMT